MHGEIIIGHDVPSSQGNFSDAFFGATNSPEQDSTPRMVLQVCSSVHRDDLSSSDLNSVESNHKRFSFNSAYFSNTSSRSPYFSNGLDNKQPLKPDDSNATEARNLGEELRVNGSDAGDDPEERPQGAHEEGVLETETFEHKCIEQSSDEETEASGETEALDRVDIEPSELSEPTESKAPVQIAAVPFLVDGWDKRDNLDTGRFRAPTATASQTSILNLAAASNERAAPPELVRVTKDMICSASTIAQTASKFVLARSGSMLLCFDQHAADERVQLEALEKQVYGNLKCGMHAEQAVLSPPGSVTVSWHEVALLALYGEALHLYGFDFAVPDASGGAAAVAVRAVPVVLGVQLSGEDMVSILHQLREFDPSGVGLQVKPAVVQYVLCSKACRSAIMFGDRLDPEECADLVKKLGQCDYPFSCAHGRPSSIVLANDLGTLFAHLAERKASSAKRGEPAHRPRGKPTKKLRFKQLMDLPLRASNE
jgi:DNA mismatch repair ATPase MutL